MAIPVPEVEGWDHNEDEEQEEFVGRNVPPVDGERVSSEEYDSAASDGHDVSDD